jgi:hypothetical protein
MTVFTAALLMSSDGKILATAKSKRMATIRLTAKQWEHIITARPELGGFMKEVLETVEEPDCVLEPLHRTKPQLLAVKRVPTLANIGLSQNLVVVYRETSLHEGFIITAFSISDRRKSRMYRLWRKLN